MAIVSSGIPHFFEEDGIEIGRIVSDSPSDGILKEGMVLQAIDNHIINDSNSYVDVVGSYHPGDNVTVNRSGNISCDIGQESEQ